MGPTTRAHFVYNRRRRRRRGGKHAVEEASDEEEQRVDSSSSSSDEEGDEEEDAEASGEDVDDEEEEEAVTVEPAVKQSSAAAAAGEKRGGRKGPISISLEKVCKVKPKFLIPNQLECGNIKFHQRRVTCLEFHPTKNNVLLSGDKKGLLGIWDYVKLHEKITYDSVHSCILNSMKIDTTNDGMVYTASSDGTISFTDLDTGIGFPLLNLNPNGWNGPSSWHMIYGMDLNTDKGLLLVADNFGFLYFLDRRSKTRIGHPILIHKKGSKVTSLHCNPARPEVLLSSGNDHYARIWDTRKLEANSPLAGLAHGRVVNSGYFSPQSGNKILTTCQDNRIRVWDYILGDLQSPSREIVHSHDFNRHLTPFKAEWDPKDYTETVAVIGRYISENYNGVALHPIDFIDTSSGKLLAEVMDPDITTISPVNKLHPQDDILATAYRKLKVALAGLFSFGNQKLKMNLLKKGPNRKTKEHVYGSSSRKKANGKHGNSSDDDSDGDSGGKNRKAKKTRFTHAVKGKGKSKV
ncbi:unnamed protein product [Miscanthus lutarioriparius]|uniref:DNA damage-binding protein 2 n=1 Tax=Miscanthus lutarioriparius TaxID=422564 RepID=A0A811P1X4_9POAL|nr:unnamed protein product [Miscanthus lutarioriparius]